MPCRDTSPVGGDVSGGEEGLHTGGPGAGEILIVGCSAGHKGDSRQVWGPGEATVSKGSPVLQPSQHTGIRVSLQSPLLASPCQGYGQCQIPPGCHRWPIPPGPHTPHIPACGHATHTPAAGTRHAGGHRPRCGSCRSLQRPSRCTAAPDLPAEWPSPLAAPWHLPVSIAPASWGGETG